MFSVAMRSTSTPSILEEHTGRRFGTPDELQNACDPRGGFFGNLLRQDVPVAEKMIFHSAGNARLFLLWHRSIAQGNDDALAWLSFAIAVFASRDFLNRQDVPKA